MQDRRGKSGAAPDDLRDRFNRFRFRQLDRILSAIVEMLAVDQRDRRVEHRPEQRFAGHATVNLVFRIQAVPGIGRIGVGVDHSPAHLGVQRRHADPQPLRRPGRRQHMLIVSQD